MLRSWFTVAGMGANALETHGQLPLSTVLSRCLAALDASFTRAGAGSLPDPSLAMMRNLLRELSPDGDSEAALVAKTCVSRRALRTMVTGAEGAGWAATGASGQRGAGHIVRLTDDGLAARDRWPTIEDAAVTDWLGTIGKRRTDQARSAAAALVGQLDLEWPHHPVTYGGSDPSVTGGAHRDGSPGPPLIPAHGQDWKPVVRQSSAGVVDLAIDALWSQLLTSFASDYEQERVGSLAIAMMLRHAVDEWVPISEFPPEAMVSGEGRSLLERHGIVDLKADDSQPLPKGHQGNQARPSRIGRTIRDSHASVTARIEENWRGRYGPRAVDDLRASLEAITTKLPTGLPDHFIAPPARR